MAVATLVSREETEAQVFPATQQQWASTETRQLALEAPQGGLSAPLTEGATEASRG